jgi:hypothetical protein
MSSREIQSMIASLLLILITNRGGIWNALELLETSTELTVCRTDINSRMFLIACDRICLMSTLCHAKQNERKPGLTTIRHFSKK